MLSTRTFHKSHSIASVLELGGLADGPSKSLLLPKVYCSMVRAGSHSAYWCTVIPAHGTTAIHPPSLHILPTLQVFLLMSLLETDLYWA